MTLVSMGQRQFLITLWLAIGVGFFASVAAQAQNPPPPRPTSAPPTQPTAQPTPLPQATPFSTPSLPVSPISPANTPASTPPTAAALAGATSQPQLLTLDDALRLSSGLASNLQQAGLNEQIAAEDVRQAQVAFLPRVSAPLSYLYTSPALGLPPGTPRTPSFLANNAIGEYQAYVNLAGDIDIAGRLRATLAKNRALLDAARAGSEVARRALAEAV